MNKSEAYEHLLELQQEIRNMDIVLNGEIIHVSITFGISDSDNENDLNKLIEIADDHLYIGKKEGRDRIILEDE